MSSSEKRSKQTRSSSFRKDRLILFLTGCALGVACFLWVYGAKIINPLYDSWLFNTDMDLKQHYIGWCHYRMSDWHFPVGLIDTLSYPISVSVIYTDSIPVLALIFKLFRNILPQHFQYFGMFGLLSFALMGGISSLLVHSLIAGAGIRRTGSPSSAQDKNESLSDTPFPFINDNLEYIVSAAASLVYILSFTVLQRMFYHTALGAQWIIVLALYILVGRMQDGYHCEPDNKPVSSGTKTEKLKTALMYALMGILCVSIHTYYIPMVGSILLAASVTHIVKLNRTLTNSTASGILSETANLISFCLAGLLTLYIFGGFYGASSGYGYGFGSFISNLNTFINPLYGSIVLKPMKLYYEWQYEGYGYLGAGVLLCILIVIGDCLYRRFIKRSDKKAGNEGTEGSKHRIKACISRHPARCTGIALLAIDMLLAVYPLLSFSDIKLTGMPQPEIIRRVFGIFRSNGRFIWVPVYLLMTGAIVYTYRLLAGRLLNMNKGKSILLKAMLLLVLIQVLDATKVVNQKQAYFKVWQDYTNVWAMAPFPAGDPSYREFVFLYNDNDIMMDTAFYAYLNGKSLNNYYYARDIDNEVNKCIEAFRSELISGMVRDDVIYIFKKDDPLADALRQWNEDEKNTPRISWYEIDEEHTALVR